MINHVMPSYCKRLLSTTSRQAKRFEAFGAHLDQDALAKARSWRNTFKASQLPKGNTTFARSSGPGGQHVNKTETKAVTSYPIQELLSVLPAPLHATLRASRYYTASSDSLSFQAQTSRSRTANTEENRAKLMSEIDRIYEEMIPGETSVAKKKKYEQIEKKFHESRMQDKKFKSAKKQSRKASYE